jgi:hypothetical protein
MHGLLNIVFNDEGAKIIMKCSSIDPHEDFDIFIIEGHIKEFLIGTSFCTTVDCFLMKIGTLFGRIEDDFGLEKSEKVVSKVLKCDEVREALRPLRNYIAPAEKMIMEDPRHARLQRYLPLLIPSIMELAPIKMRLEMKREPLPQLEGKGVGELFPTPVKVYSSKEEETKRKKKRSIFQASENSVPVKIEQSKTNQMKKGMCFSEHNIRNIYILSWLIAIVSLALPWFVMGFKNPQCPSCSLYFSVPGYELLRGSLWGDVVIYILGILIGIKAIFTEPNKGSWLYILSGLLLLAGASLAYYSLKSALDYVNTFTRIISGPFCTDPNQCTAFNIGYGIIIGAVAGLMQIAIFFLV